MPRYATDLKDEEWALVAPFMPAPRRMGRPREVDLREVVNAMSWPPFPWTSICRRMPEDG
jgi:transposase